MPNKLRDGLAIGLFVILAGYVAFSGIRLGLLLLDRFGCPDHCQSLQKTRFRHDCRPTDPRRQHSDLPTHE